MYPFLNKWQLMPVLCSIVLISSCKTTSLNDNLGTKVSAQGSQVVFEWAENHPFANDYARQPMQLVAEYTELTADGRTRPVRQIVSNADNRLTEIRQKVFVLPSQLRSVPDNDNICLYLQVQRNLIPVRAAGAADTARFAYPHWQQQVASTTHQNILQRDLQLAQQNLAVASQNVSDAHQQYQAQLVDYNQQLATETLQHPLEITSVASCDNISVEPASLQIPRDVVAPDQIPDTAARICVHRAKQSALVLRYTTTLNAQSLQKLNESVEGAQKNFLQHFARLEAVYDQHTKNRQYQPELGSVDDYIGVSPYVRKLQSDVLSSIRSSNPFTSEQTKTLRSVLAHEIQEFKSCMSEGELQLLTKYQAWQQRKNAIPERALARTEFLIDKCKLLFHTTSSKIETLSKQQSSAESILIKLQNQLNQVDSKKALPAKPLTLNSLSCVL